MKPMIMIAGAIVALIALCALAAGAYSLAFQGQAQQQTCTASGYVVDTYGKGLPGLDVTLHVLSYDNSTETSKELYTITTKTNETPKAGAFAFDRVRILEGVILAYAETSITVNGTTFTGRSNNYTLVANGNITTGIVLRTQTRPVHVPPEGNPMCALIGNVTDAQGNPLAGVNVTVHVMGVRASTGAIQEVYNQTITSHGDQPLAGRFTGSIFVPTGMENVDAFVVKYVYMDAFILDNGTTLYGRSDNFTIKANATVFANLTCVPSPPPVG